ncbi:hypothetical protein ACIO6T_30555 [Streptomyces sp. NPDC087532]|uniref:hypothetical protein n=1 Tax=Streptomyces sp. NPDC087532 TaxID=3365795 RepID=UPI0037FF99A7
MGERGQSTLHPYRVVACDLTDRLLDLAAGGAVQRVLPGGVGIPIGFVEPAALYDRLGTEGVEPLPCLGAGPAYGSTRRDLGDAVEAFPLNRPSRHRKFDRCIIRPRTLRRWGLGETNGCGGPP